MVWNAGLPLVTTQLVASPPIFQTNQAAIQSVLTTTNLTTSLPYIPTTAPVFFYSDVAPPGWTLLGAVTDTLLAVKGGTTYTTGGVVAGTWSGPPHTLTIPEMPAHFHSFQTYQGGGGSTGVGLDSTFQAPVNTSTVGGSGPHSHDWTTTRPMAAVGVICQKNP